MISISGMPYTFGFGLSFNMGLPVGNEIGQQGKLWGFVFLVGPLIIQVSYVRP